jgi:hypothetical protein
MKKHYFFRLLIVFLLVVTAGWITRAQTSNFKSLNGEIQSIQKQLVPDKRTAILDISIKDTLRKTVTIKGETNLPEGKQQILKLLAVKGIQFVDSIRLFPDASLRDKIWGLTTLSVASMRSQPDHASEMVSQALMGTPLKVLEFKDGWYRVQTPDYYIGWMEGHGLTQFTSNEMDRWRKSDRYVYNRITGNAFASAKRKSMIVTDLVLGDLIEGEAVTHKYIKIRIPDGRTAYVKKKDCLSWKVWTSRKPDAQAIISVGMQMIGVPYLWGGTSCKNVDCSGFTKTLYFSQGVILARDASQQARYGMHPDFKDIPSLEPGDLLFFGRSALHVNHVGLYLGNGKYIQSSGLVRINSINPNDPAYDITERKQLIGSCRVLNSLNTEGIVLVKDHPWY